VSGRTAPDNQLGVSKPDLSRNLRQLLLRAHREVNAVVAAELARRGHDDIRLVHSRVLENLDRHGNSVTEVAKRAQMTKQAVGTLAKELEDKGYLRRVADENDRRAWVLRFTPKGWRLMLETFEIIAKIERRMATHLGRAQFAALRTGLAAISDENTLRVSSARKPRRRNGA
jgi:DNA-binding MarR family transcriptional regulator